MNPPRRPGFVRLLTLLGCWLFAGPAESQPLRVGVYHNPPKILAGAQGRPSGMFGDLLVALAREEGWQLEPVPCQWSQCLAMLEQGEIELAVGRPARAEDLRHFSFTPLANEQMVLAVRCGHPLLRRRDTDLATLVRWPWVLQPPSSPSRQLFETELAHAGVDSPANVVECSSVFAVLQIIQGTDSVAAVSESVVRDHVRAGLIEVLPLRFGQVLQSFGILSRRGEMLSQVAQDFAGCLRDAARLGEVGDMARTLLRGHSQHATSPP